ncbi:hypothetical protein [Lysobacter solisilvae (ex Woo and Kim 2020)]|uniref:Uncharacterized protein n=1 Tax=Agrilutibacter terrestris TaxID=2865112 RepID=A0A7H0G0J3_9GAMM|nr:hypothetical protein [Lysobacter terrestris]QNP41809.1 hypothetical protein H8B22_06275 [Lysobacter terrestris]
MFGWFRRTTPVEDRVWIDAPACARGVRAQVDHALRQRAAVLLLTRSLTDREDLARDFAAHAPRIGGDRLAADDLREHLRTPAALGVAALADLRASPAAAAHRPVPLEIHVLGRSARRGDDRGLIAQLGRWAPVRIVFHHSLDDALLEPHAGALQPLLQKLGLRADEPIASPLLTRAIERAQRP